MKIIASYIAKSQSAETAYYTLPDTALRQGGQPFFIPDEGTPCIAHSCIAVRICRQGRSVSSRFAYRYYDACTCAIHFVLPTRLQHLLTVGLPWDEAVGFDGAVCVGRFLALNDILQEANETLAGIFSISNDSNQQFTSRITRKQIDASIVAASKSFTLHQGDLLLVSDEQSQGFEALFNQSIKGTINKAIILAFNVK